MSSKLFNGLTPIKAHRLVNEELKDVIKDIHGLQVRIRRRGARLRTTDKASRHSSRQYRKNEDLLQSVFWWCVQ